jgi:hypothetical protein
MQSTLFQPHPQNQPQLKKQSENQNQTENQSKAENQNQNAKQVQIKKIIYCSFAMDESFSVFHESNEHHHAQLNKLFQKLVSPYENALELIKDVESLSEITFYSFKRIYLPKGDSEILFCCSSISPKKQRNDESLMTSASSAGSAQGAAVRNLKRENCESCPMRLKFKLDVASRCYLISEDSNFNHNHSCISDSAEVVFFSFCFFCFLFYCFVFLRISFFFVLKTF